MERAVEGDRAKQAEVSAAEKRPENGKGISPKPFPL